MYARTVHVVLGMCLLLSVPALAAEPRAATPTETRVTLVALFKNGLGFFVREGNLADQSGLAAIGPFAAPTHGTLWVSCPSTAGLESVTARPVTAAREAPARDIAELLLANVGRRVTLRTSSTEITGTIIAFAPDRDTVRPDPYAMGQQQDANRILPPGRGQYVLLQSDDGIMALDPFQVSSAHFAERDINLTVTREVEQVELVASFATPKRGDWLSISYLAKGITWAPSYLVDISQQKTARLSAKAVVINEAEELAGAHVNLITGFPNLQFADIMSPMGMRERLAAFLQSLTRGASAQAPPGVVTQNVMFGARLAGEMPGQPLPEYRAAAGQVAEDLFLYPVENVTLAKGETGYYPLFTEAVPYTECYQWEVPDYVNEQDRYGQARREEAGRAEIVWHSLRLTNAGAVPWTTAPVQLMKDGQLIGQSTLNYTPPKGQSTVRITQAVNVRAEQSEVEVNREREAVRLYGDTFDRVTIEGKLSVTNFAPKSISLEIAKTLSGEITSTSIPAEDVALARGLARMNPTHLLTWTIQLEPEARQDIRYTYQVLIRR